MCLCEDSSKIHFLKPWERLTIAHHVLKLMQKTLSPWTNTKKGLVNSKIFMQRQESRDIEIPREHLSRASI